ncbi:MAG: exodeoxyribonuclease-3 [Moritella dasanensis]|jgi:exodeoxyribonuclease-3
MKIISFNINGLRARLHQLQAIIDKHAPDVIGLQEIKVHNEMFPVAAVENMGYHVFFHGQKAHYGVAMMVKKSTVADLEAIKVQYGFPTDDEEAQKRMIMVTFEQTSGKPITVLNGYFPQGENISHETKYPYKRKFYEDLNIYLNDNHTAEDDLIVMGDINISPAEKDIGIGEPNAKRWLKTGKCSFQPEEREWLAKLQGFGLHDTFRTIKPEVSDRYSWFDYRSKGFPDNRGLRIDVILATATLNAKVVESDVDYELRGIEKPSDHAPIWTTFE